ncbi:hypothetical protein [Actinocorallia populi]|uniref:hypothetical protein n=1 Tax=Actinocorallia populi TaxID=2079200 RepID=UPI000D09737F|nr:hypothetical protein [Actinocorallia populi]
MPPSMRGKFWPALLLLTLAACNSGAIETPGGENESDTTATASQRPDGGNPGPGDKPDYSHLDFPLGDTSTDVRPGYVYYQLTQQNCAKAQSTLEKNLNGPADYHIDSATARLLRVGIALCGRDTATATRLFTGAAKPADSWFMCELYRTAGSVLRAQPRSAFGTCPDIPAFPGPPDDPYPEDPGPDVDEPGTQEPEVPGTGESPAPEPEVPEGEPIETPAPAG